MQTLEETLTEAGVKPTSNRIIVFRELLKSPRPLSLGELDTAIETLTKSSILRVLTLLIEHHLIHTVEDGRGIVKYELCHGGANCTDNDMHVHFYCEECREVYCFEDIPVPQIALPEEFHIHSVNYMLKGVCPSCRASKRF